jgi:TolB-like protein/Tfp pilus assembly protein PilF
MLIGGASLWLKPWDSEQESPVQASVDSVQQQALKPSIVVLPFEELSNDASQEPFADGITEDIITDLSGLSRLMVIASNTSFTFKGKTVNAQTIGKELGVDYVLEGSIRRYGDSVRVNAQLVDAGTGFQKWAKRYDREVTEVFAVQDELTGEIVESLSVTLSPQEASRLARRPTNNLLAYDHFQEGQRLSRISARETNQEAQMAYRRAIEADPAYGRAYGALAYILSFNYLRGWNDSPMQTIDRALELAQKGVELDPNIPQTYWSLGYVHLVRKEFDQAQAAVHEALRIAPNYADGYGLLALIQNNMDDAESAIANIRKGMALNPHYTWDYPYNLGRAYYILGQYDKAVELLEAAKVRNPNALPIRRILAASYVRTGRDDDAEWEVEEIQTLSPEETLSHLKKTLVSGSTESAQRVLDDLRQAGLPE